MAVSNRAIDLFEMVSKYRNGQIPLDEFRRKQITWMDQETRLQDLRVAQNVGIVQIDSTEFRDATTPSPIGKIAEMRETLPKLARDAYAEFIAEIHDATAKLSTRLDAAQELCDRMRFVQHLREGHMDVLTKRAEECAALYALVREFSFAVTDASAAEFATSEKDFNLLKTVLEDAEGTQEEKISLFASELEDRIKEVNREARELVKAASDETILDPDSGREKVEKLLRDLTLRAESTTAESQKINTIQVTFGSCETVFDVLKEAAADVALKVAAWAGDGAFDADVLVWAKTVFDKIDVPRMTDKMGGYVKLSARLEKGLAPNKMAQRFAAKVEDYKNLLPVINALLNTSMKQRHWDKVAALIGVPIVRDDFFTLQKILDLKAPAHGEAIGLVSTEATQEQALEEMLHKVVAKWADVCFQGAGFSQSPRSADCLLYTLSNPSYTLRETDTFFFISSRALQGIERHVYARGHRGDFNRPGGQHGHHVNNNVLPVRQGHPGNRGEGGGAAFVVWRDPGRVARGAEKLDVPGNHFQRARYSATTPERGETVLRGG
jgi:dynein heavy chain